MNAHAPIPTAAAIAETIATCWQRGNTIGETRETIARAYGLRLTFDDIHPHFVRLAAQVAA